MSVDQYIWITLVGIVLFGFWSKARVPLTFFLTFASFFAALDITHFMMSAPTGPSPFNEPILNPNVSSLLLCCALFLTPEFKVQFLGARISVLLDVSIGLLIFWSESRIGQVTFLILILFRSRASHRFSIWRLVIASLLFLAYSITIHQQIQRSIQARLIIWDVALDIFRDNWLLGIGGSSFAQEFFFYGFERYSTFKRKPSLVVDPHNILLDLLLTFGLAVGILFLMLAISLFFFDLRQWNDNLYRKDSKLLVFCYLLQGMVNVNSFFVSIVFTATYMFLRIMNSNLDQTFNSQNISNNEG